jgi:hypothetical protein
MRQRIGAPALAVACLTAGLLGADPVRAFDVHGLADVRYERSSTPGSLNRNGSFVLGQLDFFIQQTIGNRFDVLGEVVFETAGDEGIAEVERLHVGYRLTDQLAVRAGRFHNPIGYWNTAFHHGTIYQMTIGRPEFLEFEDDGGVLPVHVVGLDLVGNVPAGPVALRFGLLVGNGSKIDTDEHTLVPNVNADDSRNKLVSAEFAVSPKVPGRFTVGTFFNHSQVQGFPGGDAEAAPAFRVSQDIWGFDLVYAVPLGRRIRAELISEWFMIGNADRTNGSDDYASMAAYVQGAVTFNDQWSPYGRWEQLDLDDDGDPYFEGLAAESYQRAIYGLRFNLSVENALKAEARVVNHDDLGRFMEYAAQWAFAF